MEQTKKVPVLRFPEFSGGWGKTTLGEVSKFLDGIRKPVKESDRLKMKGKYPYYGASGIIDYVNDFIFDEDIILLGEDGENILSRNLPLAFKVSGKCWVNNHAHVIKPDNKTSIDFITQYLDNISYVKYNTGTAQPKLNQEICRTIPLNIPTLPEQQKIADFLTQIDNKINQLSQKKQLLERYKKGVMQQIFSQSIRFTDDDGREFTEWEEKEFDEIFSSLSTKQYQVLNSEIIDSGNFKVIDQGQKNIAGYSNDESKLFTNLPIIIFGDHTTILKYIDFKFIVGADGTKILKNKIGYLKFFYYCLAFNKIEPEGYKRHFSILKTIQLFIPCIEEQTKIANFLTALDDKIALVEKQLNGTKQYKKGLLQQLFI